MNPHTKGGVEMNMNQHEYDLVRLVIKCFTWVCIVSILAVGPSRCAIKLTPPPDSSTQKPVVT